MIQRYSESIYSFSLLFIMENILVQWSCKYCNPSWMHGIDGDYKIEEDNITIQLWNAEWQEAGKI